MGHGHVAVEHPCESFPPSSLALGSTGGQTDLKVSCLLAKENSLGRLVQAMGSHSTEPPCWGNRDSGGIEAEEDSL